MAYSLLWSGPPPGCDRSGKPCLGRTCLQARKRHCRASGVRSDIEREVTAAQAGLILPRGSPGAWDTGCIGNPVVRWYKGDNEQRWYMWYSGRTTASDSMDCIHPAAGAIGVATSTDGVQWTRGHGNVEGAKGEESVGDVGCMLRPNVDEWWWHDTRQLAVSDVQVFSREAVSEGTGVYWMYYSGGNFEAVAPPEALASGLQSQSAVEGLRTRAGLAMSQDGRNWARIEASHHTGALLDAGKEGEWDAAFVAGPQVVGSMGDLRMYYHSFDASSQQWTIGLAASQDGVAWCKQGPLFSGSGHHYDAHGASAHHVVQDFASKRYVMFYEAVAEDDARTIGMAVSRDGLTDWQCLPEPILQSAASTKVEGDESSSSPAWDGHGIGAPCAIAMAEGQWRLYYAGREQPGAWTGIGLAITDITKLHELESVRTAFKRIRPRALD